MADTTDMMYHAWQYQQAGQTVRAKQVLRALLVQHPGHAEALHALGLLAYEAGEFEEACRLIQKAVKAAPGIALCHYNLGQVFMALARQLEAIASYREAVRLDSGYAMGFNGLGMALRESGDYEGALEAYDRALAIDPVFISAHWNRAWVLLVTGRLHEGWQAYKWGLKTSKRQRGIHQLPIWGGGSSVGDGLLVCTEQGIGDQIMFLSCLPDLLEVITPALCLVEADPRLVPLLSRSFPQAQFHGVQADAPDDWMALYPPVSSMIHMGSLPGLFRNEFDQFPDLACYLTPDPASVARWRERYRVLGDGIVVGISWRGGNDAATRRLRSTQLAQWTPVFTIPGVHFVNLQYGDCAEEIGQARSDCGVIIHDWDDVDPLSHLDDFAAQIHALDLVISIDNSTLHIAGATGTPTLALLPYAPEWRWLLQREDTPWYPALTLLRQSHMGEWGDVFRRVAIMLADMV